MLKILKHWRALTIAVMATAAVALLAVPAHASGPAPWPSQKWDFGSTEANPYQYEIESEQPHWGWFYRGLCIDDKDWQHWSGAQVWTWQCEGGGGEQQANQLWEVHNNIDGTVSFALVYDDTKCLDVSGWNTDNGAQLDIYTCAWTTDANGNHGNHLNQEFWTGANGFNGWQWDGSVRSALNPDKCLTAANDAGQDANGDDLILWSCGTWG
jgi:hypothetical protein